MSSIFNRYIKFEDQKRLVAIGIGFVGIIGLLWSVLYWRNDIKFAIGIIALYILCGVIVTLLAVGLASIVKVKVNLTGLLVFLLGVFWVSPILLYKARFYYNVNFSDSPKGLLILIILVSGACLSGFLGGYFLERYGLLTRLIFAVIFSLVIPLYFGLRFPEISSHNITIVDRLNDKQIEIQPQTRVMVFGIDGATWNAVIPLLKKGKLSALRTLMENGQYGVLKSIKGRTLSPVVWTSIFTGKLPKNHGVTEWVFSDSRNRFSKSLWNILNDYGQKTITVNIPGTFPPERTLGIQVSGFPIPGITKTSDGGIQQYGRIYTTEDRNLKVVPTTNIEIKPAEAWISKPTSYSPLYESRILLTENILKKYMAYTLYLENLFLEFLDQRGIFQTSEEYTAFPVLIVDTTNDGVLNHDTLYVFSSKNNPNPVAVIKKGQWSNWIKLDVNRAETQFKLRLLNLSKDSLDIYTTPLFQSSLNPQIPFTYPLNISSEMSKVIGQYVVEGAGWNIYKDEITLDLLYEHIEDISNQQVHASKYFLKEFPDWKLFVHLFTESDRVMHPYWKYFQPEFYERVNKNLVKAHGNKINSIIGKIDADIRKFLAYSDENTTVIVVSDHGFHASLKKGEGGHAPEGIYIFSGKGIKNTKSLSLNIESFPEASVLDITPTILYLMGYPVSRNMDGKVLLNIFKKEKLECCPVQFVTSYEDGSLKKGPTKQTIDESTENQLRSLGYIE